MEMKKIHKHEQYKKYCVSLLYDISNAHHDSMKILCMEVKKKRAMFFQEIWSVLFSMTEVIEKSASSHEEAACDLRDINWKQLIDSTRRKKQNL